MADVRGKQCDICGKIFHTEAKPAEKYMVLRVVTMQDGHPNGGTGEKDICSNECLYQHARDRRGMVNRATKQGQAPRARVWTQEAEENRKAGARRANHERHHIQKGVYNPDCQLCVEESGLDT